MEAGDQLLLLAQVGTGEFAAYAASHGQRTTYVRSNWLRTVAWMTRGGLVLYLLARAMRGGQW